MTKEDFRVQNWDLMDEAERAIWLNVFGLDSTETFVEDGEVLTDLDPKDEVYLDANLIQSCEARLGGRVDLYLKNCLSEASVLTYAGMTAEEVQHPDTAPKFYKTVLLLPIGVRAKCLYWTLRGEEV